MPGRLGKNLRSGHIAEDIGILFLRSFCAVATTRQEDDYGTDAIATLLREDNGMLYAENSFYVQIKSSSVKKIDLNEDETNWILNQDLPYFILSVDRVNQEIYLYTTNPLYEIVTLPEIKKLRITFESLQEREYDRFKIENETAIYKLGPPIIQISEADSRISENSQQIYSLMKVWIEKEREQFELRKLGRTQIFKWDTWKEPATFGTRNYGNSENLKRDLEKIKPYLEYIGNHITMNQFFDDSSAINAFRYILEWYKNEDIEIDLDEDSFKKRQDKQ